MRGGAKLVVAFDRDADGLADLADAATRLGGRISTILGDVTDETALADAMEQTARQRGPLDSAVNAAGIGNVTGQIVEYDAERWRRVIDINLTAMFLRVKHEARVMRASGRPVTIVNVSTANSRRPIRSGGSPTPMRWRAPSAG